MLAALCRDGTVPASFRKRTGAAFTFLIQTLLRVDRPQEALALLQRHGRAGVGGQALNIGNALLAAGDTTNAREAFLIGKRDADTIIPLLKLDPTAAREALETTLEAGDETLAMLQTFDGSPEQAERGLTRLAKLIQDGDLSTWSWQELLKSRPEFVEQKTRERLATADLDDDDKARARDRLARSLLALGRSKDAIAIAMASLTENPDADFRVQLLADLDRDAAIAWTRQRALDTPNQETHAAYGDQLMAAKRKREAFDAYARAHALDPSRASYTKLIRADPVLATNRLLPQAETSQDDEMIGDVADALWKQGQTNRAFSLWRRALRFDSDDSEWIRKVQAVREKRSPF